MWEHFPRSSWKHRSVVRGADNVMKLYDGKVTNLPTVLERIKNKSIIVHTYEHKQKTIFCDKMLTCKFVSGSIFWTGPLVARGSDTLMDWLGSSGAGTLSGCEGSSPKLQHQTLFSQPTLNSDNRYPNLMLYTISSPHKRVLMNHNFLIQLDHVCL